MCIYVYKYICVCIKSLCCINTEEINTTVNQLHLNKRTPAELLESSPGHSLLIGKSIPHHLIWTCRWTGLYFATEQRPIQPPTLSQLEWSACRLEIQSHSSFGADRCSPFFPKLPTSVLKLSSSLGLTSLRSFLKFTGTQQEIGYQPHKLPSTSCCLFAATFILNICNI